MIHSDYEVSSFINKGNVRKQVGIFLE